MANIKSILIIEPNNSYYDESALEEPLGGSETALLFMLRFLRENVDKYYYDVAFKEELPIRWKDKKYDLVISYRSPSPLLSIRGKINAAFFQDLPSPESIMILQRLVEMGRIDRFIFLSHDQKSQYLQGLPTIQESRQCLMHDNGIDLSLFDSSIEKENAFIYASAPNRGLDILLEVWPEIHKQLPEYTLKVAGSTKMYNVKGNDTNRDREFLLAVGNSLYNQPFQGIEWLGGLKHSDLVKEMEKSKLLLYPSTFVETSCHILNCALHAGASPITSQMGVLVEKICHGDNGLVIPGDPNSWEFKSNYVKAVVDTIRSGRGDRFTEVNRGNYQGLDYKVLNRRMFDLLLDYMEVDGENQKIMGICCSLYGNNKKNFNNITWYSPYDMQIGEINNMPTDQARNTAASQALYARADWLLFLDDDIYVHPTFLIEMMDRALKNNSDVVVANYYYKDDNSLIPVARIARRSDGRAVSCLDMTEEEVNSDKYRFIMSGLGACLINTNVFRTIGRPYFRTQTIRPKHLGEDSYFFQMCNMHNLKIYLALDIPVIHVGNGKAYGRKEHIDKVLPTLIKG